MISTKIHLSTVFSKLSYLLQTKWSRKLNTVTMPYLSPTSQQRHPLWNASSAQQTISVVGDAWTLKILRAMFQGRNRFSELLLDCQVSRAVLTDRLNHLTHQQVIARQVIEGGHPSYALTDRGLDLWRLFLAMWLWETEWDAAPSTATWAPRALRSQVVHRDCGHAMRPIMQCLHCQTEVSPFETKALPASPRSGSSPAATFTSAFRRGRSSDTPKAQNQKLIQIIGDRWTAAIVAAAFRGIRTFSGFEHELSIRPTQLSQRLTELLALGVLRGQDYAGSRREYRLTRAGVALFPITLELVRWGNLWVSSDEARLKICHLRCEQELVTGWCCAHCKLLLSPESMSFS